MADELLSDNISKLMLEPAPFSGSIPIELWIHIAGFVTPIPDLTNLVLCNSQLYHALLEPLKRLRYRKIKVNESDIRINAWYPLLLGILRSTIPVQYVQELDCGGRYQTVGPERLGKDEESLVYSAARDSRWILDDEVEQLVEEIRNGSEDAVASLVIPLLPNLHTIHLARHSWRTSKLRLLKVVTRIAKASVLAQSEIASGSPPQPPLPLSKLTLVAGVKDGSRAIGIELEDLPHFAVLPSVRRIIVTQAQDNFYEGWPRDLQRCVVPEIYFLDSSVPRHAIEDFVDQAIGGPCVVRSQWCPRVNRSRPEMDWDHFVVEGPKDPETGHIQEGDRIMKWELKYPEEHRTQGDVYDPRPPYKRHSGCSDSWGDMMEGKVWDMEDA